MRLILRCLLSSFLFFSFFVSPAQKLVDRLALYVGSGVSYLPVQANSNASIIPRNAFGGYNAGLTFSLNLLYYQTERLTLGLNTQYVVVAKENFNLKESLAGPLVKYNFNNTLNALSPFIIASIRYGYTYLNQSEYFLSGKPASSTDPSDISIEQVNLHYGYAGFGFSSIGGMLGAGLDFRINRQLKVFCMAGYSLQLCKNNQKLTEYYPDNATHLKFLSAELGINYKFTNKKYKKKVLNTVASQKAEKKKLELVKQLSDNISKRQDSLAQLSEVGDPMKFTTLSRDELDFNKTYTINGQLKGLQGHKISDVPIVIFDDKGNKIATLTTDKNGRFAHSGLKAETYLVELVEKDPKLQLSGGISEEGTPLQVEAPNAEKFHYNKLSSHTKPAGAIIGDAKLKDNGKPATDHTMLLLDKNSHIAASTQTSKNGVFAFKNLKSDTYQIIPENSINITAKAIATSADPALKVDEKDFLKFNFQKLHNGEAPQALIIGSVKPVPQLTEIHDHTVLLLDNNGLVVSETNMNKEGQFAFKNIKPDHYQAVVAGTAPTMNAHTSVGASDPTLLMPEDVFTKFDKSTYPGAAEKNITGQVQLTGSPQENANATIVLLDEKGTVIATVKPSKEGNFIIKNVRKANYQLAVEGADYEKAVYEISKNDPEHSTINSEAFDQFRYAKLQNEAADNVIVGKIKVDATFLPDSGTSVLLVDDLGNILGRVQSDIDGNFAFKNIKKGNYQVVVENQDYKEVEMRVAGKYNAANISASDFYKYQSLQNRSDKADHLIIGHVKSDKSSSPVTNKESVLLLDNKGSVKGKTIVRPDGSFTFKGLKAADYQMVLEKPDSSLRTFAQPVISDPDLKLSMKEVMKYNSETRQMENITEQDPVLITGTIRSDDFKGVENRVIMLVDDQGSIIKESTSNHSGVFKFNGINAKDYQLVYESGDKKINPVVQVYKDNDPAVTEKKGKIFNTLYYGLNEYTITENDKIELQKFVLHYKQHPDLKMIKLNAYGDAVGTDEANLEVAQKRAAVVMEYLQKQGIPTEKIKLNPLGKSLKFKNKYNQPDATLNRKVDIEIVD